MVEPIVLSTFFKTYGGSSKEDFLAEFPGAFLLVRAQGQPPGAVHIEAQEGFRMVLGSDEDADLSYELDQTLDPEHAAITYHVGFKGWNVEDLGSSFAFARPSASHIRATTTAPTSARGSLYNTQHTTANAAVL